MKRILAIDPSLTGTALIGPSTSPNLEVVGCHKIDTKGLAGTDRLRRIRDQVLDRACGNTMDPNHDGADVVLIEDYAYGQGQQAHQIGELGGVLRLALDDAGIPWIPVNVGTVKKFATGKGNANKAAMVAAVTHRTGRETPDDDIADATVIYSIGLALQGLPHPMGTLPKTHSDALTKVEWAA